ncbi:antitoxin [Jiangella ureilytica]|uniref:Antitoxin n=1 Tax=Jiangella ureilytica TaxID=2530374 RepID=A0A4R4RBX9_9ACTN|nr:antitoxin [Jiangella ureilytica]TDC46587.1 antitoxin [Jiangella ureilytica]
MGFDEIKNKVTGLISGNADKVGDGVDKATDFIDDKTGGKYSEHLEGVDDKARDFIDGLDGEKGENDKPA